MTIVRKLVSQNQWLAWAAAHLVGALLLLWIAIANGFPMLFYDSGSYLLVGKTLVYPLDRPPTYALAIAPFYLAFGMWGIAVAQSLFTMWLLGLVLERATGRRSPGALIRASALLAALSSLPWLAGQVMPDLFTGLMVLLIFMLVLAPGDPRLWMRLLLVPLLTALIGFHLSHLAIAAVLVPVAAIAGWWLGQRRRALIGAAQAAGAWLLALLALCAANLIATGDFRPAVMSETFLFARLIDGGVGREVLDEACAERALSLCAAQPLIRRSSRPGQDYLWDGASPRKALHRAAPTRARAEEAEIVRRTLAERPAAVLQLALHDWVRQLFRGATGEGMGAYSSDEWVYQVMRDHFPSSAAAWAESLQQQNRLLALASPLDRVVALLVGLASPFIFLMARRRGDKMLAGLVVLVVAAILANAAACSMLSGVSDRYQARITWLLPLVAIIAFDRLRRREVRAPAEPTEQAEGT